MKKIIMVKSVEGWKELIKVSWIRIVVDGVI